MQRWIQQQKKKNKTFFTHTVYFCVLMCSQMTGYHMVVTIIPVNGSGGIYAEHKCTLNREPSASVSAFNLLLPALAGEGSYNSKKDYPEAVRIEISDALQIPTCFPSLCSSRLFFFPSSGQGSNRSCSHQPTPQPQQRRIPPTSATYTIAHGNARARDRTESSWILVGFIIAEP